MKLFPQKTLVASLAFVLTSPLLAKPKSSLTPQSVPEKEVVKALPPLPAGPVLQRVPKFARWTITSLPVASTEAALDQALPAVKPGKLKKKPKEKPSGTKIILKETTVTKTAEIRHEETIGPDSLKTHRWCSGKLQILTAADGSQPILLTAGREENNQYVDYTKTDFAGFEWISPKNYVAVEKIRGRECLIFQDRILTVTEKELKVLLAADPALDPEQMKVAVRACIDANTRWPVEVQQRGELTTYQFEDAPKESLILPPAVQQVIDEHQRGLETTTRRPESPF